MEPPDFAGLEVLADTRIFDLRNWTDSESDAPGTLYSRMRVSRLPAAGDDPHVRLQLETSMDQLPMMCRSPRLNPRLSRLENADGSYTFELDLDFRRVPIGGRTDIRFKSALRPEAAGHTEDGGYFSFTLRAPTGLLEVWVLLPLGRRHEGFTVSGYPLGKPDESRVVVPHSTVELPAGSMTTFRLIKPDANFQYECSWTWIATP